MGVRMGKRKRRALVLLLIVPAILLTLLFFRPSSGSAIRTGTVPLIPQTAIPIAVGASLLLSKFLRRG